MNYKLPLIIIASLLLILTFWWCNYLFETHILSQKSTSLLSTKDDGDCSNCEGSVHNILEPFNSLNGEIIVAPFRKHNRTVSLPLNTYYSCENVCGPLARCYKTGEQCAKDYDCFGCKPGKNPRITKPDPIPFDEGFENNSDEDIKPVPRAISGPNSWINTYVLGMQLYKRKQQ